MDIDNFLEISILMGYYKELLSDKQKDYMIKHFERDYSLSEIADEYGVSRQAVHDNIKRGIKILHEYEAKLKFYSRDMIIKKKLEKIIQESSNINVKEIIEEYF